MSQLRALCQICRKPRCRKARPLCRRKDNSRNETCYCPGYHYPHRFKSGKCVHSPLATARMWAEVDKPVRRR